MVQGKLICDDWTNRVQLKLNINFWICMIPIFFEWICSMFWKISEREIYGTSPKIKIQKSTLLSHKVIHFFHHQKKKCKLNESKSNDFLNVNQFTFCKKKRHDDQILYRIQQGISTQIPRTILIFMTSKKIALIKKIFFCRTWKRSCYLNLL